MIFWLLSRDEPPGDESSWLSPRETVRLREFRVEKRRSDWKAGRFTAKQLLKKVFENESGGCPPLSHLEILRERSGAPYVALAPEATPFGGTEPGGRFPLSLTISHSNGTGFAGLLSWRKPETNGWPIGADLEWIEPRSRLFVEDFFVERERDIVFAAREDEQPLLANLIWSAKEAALKALKYGLTIDTRDVRVFFERRPDALPFPGPEGGGWQPLEFEMSSRIPRTANRFAGFWTVRQGFVLTLAALNERKTSS